VDTAAEAFVGGDNDEEFAGSDGGLFGGCFGVFEEF